MSREALCRACGMSSRALERIERGRTPGRGFGLMELCRVASALGVSPDSLLKHCEEALAPCDAWWTGMAKKGRKGP
jgi:transcriptional regulator with XRE-family HTH domain